MAKLAMLLYFLASPRPSWATTEMTLPEFECTAIQIEDRPSTERVLGRSRFPSLSLRRYRSGDWQFTTNRKSIDLKISAIVKKEQTLKNGVSYEIPYQNSILKVELVGTPPSRQGFLWNNVTPPLDAKLLAKLTCH